MKLVVSNLLTRVEAPPEESTWLRDYLSYEDARAKYSAAYQRGKWDGKVRLYSAVGRTFPTGLLRTVVKAAKETGWRVEIEDDRSFMEPEEADTSWLDADRDRDQRPALAACLKQKRGVIKAATGMGKTEVIAALCMSVQCRWLIMVNETTLLKQTARRLEERIGERIGLWGGGGKDTDCRVTLAMFQSLYKTDKPEVRGLLRGAHGIISDECHLVPAASFYRVMMATPFAAWRFGFSGTPNARGDKRGIFLRAAVGPVIYEVNAATLVDRGVLSRPTIRFVEAPQPDMVDFNPTEPRWVWRGRTRVKVDLPVWGPVYARGVVESASRNAKVAATAMAAARPCLLFVKEIRHGKALEKVIGRAGAKVEFVWGKDSAEQRLAACRRLARGDVDVLITSPIFDQGIDVPEVRSVLIATGGTSAIRALQRLGRGMRVTPDKATMELWDFMDTGHRWLEKHAEGRKAIYEREGFDVEVVEVPTKAALVG